MKYKPPAGLPPSYHCNECSVPVHAPSVLNNLLYCKSCYFRLKLIEDALATWEREGDPTIENYKPDE